MAYNKSKYVKLCGYVADTYWPLSFLVDTLGDLYDFPARPACN